MNQKTQATDRFRQRREISAGKGKTGVKTGSYTQSVVKWRMVCDFGREKLVLFHQFPGACLERSDKSCGRI